MKNRNYPIHTPVLLAILVALHALMAGNTTLYFSSAEILDGQVWRLLTGHLVHADWSHLLWNTLGLAVLGWLIERHSSRLFWTAIAAGMVSVNALLFSPLSNLDYYCGLSGVLNSLLVTALWMEWRSSRSWWIVAIAIACLFKAVIETGSGASLITQISWPPFALSHLAGMTGGIIVLILGADRIRVPAATFRPDICRPQYQRHTVQVKIKARIEHERWIRLRLAGHWFRFRRQRFRPAPE